VAVPAPAPAAGAAPALSSFADTLRRLRTAVHRDAVAEAVLDYMTRICGRSAFLALRRSTLQAAGSRGFGGAQGEILSHAISIEASSVFRDVASTRLPYRGPLPAAATEAAFARAAGGVQGDVVLVPIVVRDRSVAVVFGDGVQAAVEEGSLVAIAHEAGRAFGRIITAAKPQ
jgi:hypothetical protein